MYRFLKILFTYLHVLDEFPEAFFENGCCFRDLLATFFNVQLDEGK